jgi:hypothetical protein
MAASHGGLSSMKLVSFQCASNIEVLTYRLVVLFVKFFASILNFLNFLVANEGKVVPVLK